MTILLNAGNEQRTRDWYTQLRRHSNKHIIRYPHVKDRLAIEYALVWEHPHGDLQNYPNLRAIFSLGAGVEHITTDPNVPKLPIVRLVDPGMSTEMAHYCLYWTLAFQRRFTSYTEQQRQQHWQGYSYQTNDQFNIGVLGLGHIGQVIAHTFVGMNYHVSGWSTSPKMLEGITCYTGNAERDNFLTSIDLLIICLPLTSDTQGMIDAGFLAAMQPGSYLINIGRGAIINEQDLLNALNTGHIREAALDVFGTEPLPQHSPYWQQQGLHITPHIAGLTTPGTATPIILNNIERVEKGEQPYPLYNAQKGY